MPIIWKYLNVLKSTRYLFLKTGFKYLRNNLETLDIGAIGRDAYSSQLQPPNEDKLSPLDPPHFKKIWWGQKEVKYSALSSILYDQRILERWSDFIRPMEALASPAAVNKPKNIGEFTACRVKLDQWETGDGKELTDKVLVFSVPYRLSWALSLSQTSCITEQQAVFLVRLWTAL